MNKLKRMNGRERTFLLITIQGGVPGVTRFHLQQSAVRMNDDYASLICDITPPFSRTVIRMKARMLPATVEIRNGTT